MMTSELILAALAAVAPLVLQHLSAWLKMRLPNILHPDPAPKPDAPPPLTPDGRGGLLKELALRLLKARLGLQALSPDEQRDAEMVKALLAEDKK